MIEVKDWGKDHWSTFAYIETRIVDFSGVPNKEHLRCNLKLHPQYGHRGGCASKYPTRLREGVAVDHDDWSCLDDAVEAGLLETVGTGLFPVYKLTDAGLKLAAELRTHKASGGAFSNFRPVG